MPEGDRQTAPRYQDVESVDKPEIIDDDGTRVRIVCGGFWGKRGASANRTV
jgi:quercetin 2,3-dioxygenase